MEYTDYIVSAPIDTVWVIAGLVSISAIVWFVKKKRQ
jgi:LPXTG-motif cell wall-anchored protein